MDELIPTRATLIQRLKNWQDQSSWQDFFETYWRLIYDVARKGGLTDCEAEDVVQETMVAVAKQMPTFKYDPSIGSFKTWLFNMTRWRIADQLRLRGPAPDPDALIPVASDSRDQAAEDEDVRHEEADPNIQKLDDLWDDEWERNLLDAAVARIRRRLDPQKYQIFDLYAKKGWPPEKVAATFEIPVDHVYLVKHRVTEMIRREVKRLEVEMV